MKRSRQRLACGHWLVTMALALGAAASCRDLDAPPLQLGLAGGTQSSSAGAGGTQSSNSSAGAGGTQAARGPRPLLGAGGGSGRSAAEAAGGTGGGAGEGGVFGTPAEITGGRAESRGAGVAGPAGGGTGASGAGGAFAAGAGESGADNEAGAGGFDGLPVVAWTPLELSNLDVWLRADANFDVSAPVATWADESGKNNHATQADRLLQPKWDPRGFAGRPGVRFDGHDDWLAVPDGETTRPGIDPFVVAVAFLQISAISQSWGGGSALISKHHPAIYPYLGFGLFANATLGADDHQTRTGEIAARINGQTQQLIDDASVTRGVFSTAFTSQLDDTLYNDGAPRVVLMVRTVAELAIRVNGREHDHDDVNPWETASGPGANILNGGREAADQGIDGVIAEIVFARRVPSAEVELIERYLLRKYADVLVDP